MSWSVYHWKNPKKSVHRWPLKLYLKPTTLESSELYTCRQSICRGCRTCWHAWPSARQAGCSTSRHASRRRGRSRPAGGGWGCSWIAAAARRWRWGRCRRGCRYCTGRCGRTRGWRRSWRRDRTCGMTSGIWSRRTTVWIDRCCPRSWSESTSRRPCRDCRSSCPWQHCPPAQRELQAMFHQSTYKRKKDADFVQFSILTRIPLRLMKGLEEALLYSTIFFASCGT